MFLLSFFVGQCKYSMVQGSFKVAKFIIVVSNWVRYSVGDLYRENLFTRNFATCPAQYIFLANLKLRRAELLCAHNVAVNFASLF
jgi:hypothetical protein